MQAEKHIAKKNYQPNFVPGAIEETMQELGLSREEAIKFMTDTSYQSDYPRKIKSRKKQV